MERNDQRKQRERVVLVQRRRGRLLVRLQELMRWNVKRRHIEKVKKAVSAVLAAGILLLPFPAPSLAQPGDGYYQKGFQDASGCFSSNGQIFCFTTAPAEQLEACVTSYQAGFAAGEKVAQGILEQAYQDGRQHGIGEACAGKRKFVPLPHLNEPCSPERQNAFSRGMNDGHAAVKLDAQECRRAGLRKEPPAAEGSSPSAPPPTLAPLPPVESGEVRTPARKAEPEPRESASGGGAAGAALLVGGAVAVGAIAIGMAAGSSGGGGGSGCKCSSGYYYCGTSGVSYGQGICCPQGYDYICSDKKCYKSQFDKPSGTSCAMCGGC